LKAARRNFVPAVSSMAGRGENQGKLIIAVD
jgi:hypothetical protein